MGLNDNKSPVKPFRLTARILGLFIVAFWLLMGIGYAFSDSEPFTYESLIITILIVVTTISFVVAWWKNEKIGGIILVIAGIIHSTFAYIVAGHNKLFAVLISGIPYIIIGCLFLLACKKSNPIKNKV